MNGGHSGHREVIMGIDWDSTLKRWAEAVDQDSQKRGSGTQDAIRAAIHKSEELKGRG
jgi:hypothetical protein